MDRLSRIYKMYEEPLDAAKEYLLTNILAKRGGGRVRERSQSIQAINYIEVPGRVTVPGVGPAELPRRRAALAPARVPAPVSLVPSARRRGLAAPAPAVGRPLEAQVVQRRALTV
jgi:hypothetical protein